MQCNCMTAFVTIITQQQTCGCKSAILAVNVIGGMLEPAKTYLSELCIKPARIPTNQVKTEKPTKHRKKKKKKQQ